MEENPVTSSLIADWGHLIFVSICSLSFLLALVLTLDIPLKFALIIGLTPLAFVLLIIVLFFLILKFKVSNFRLKFSEVSQNETTTRIIKSILLPVLLVLLYLYIRGEEGHNILYTSSAISSEMIVHPCGSSYDREGVIWDAADLISQPSDTEVFVVTNAIFARNQTRGFCEQTGAYCSTTNINPGRQRPKWLSNVPWIFSHDHSRQNIWNPISCPRPEVDELPTCPQGILYDNGIQTGDCDDERTCIISGWCPPISLEDFGDALFNTEDFTIFLDLRPDFPDFKEVSWTKGGHPGGYSANYAEIYAKHYKYFRSVETCLFDKEGDPYCPRFALKDIVELSGQSGTIGNWTEAEILGGQFKIEVDWNCKFDWGLDIYDCLPDFRFLNRANNKGKPKIYPKITYQDEIKRTVTYSLGISVSISHTGRGLQIQLFNFLFYSQFIFVSYKMIKGPVLWIVRCILTTFLMVKQGCGQKE